MTTTVRDSQRTLVYAAETMFGRMLEKAASCPLVEVGGVTVTAPALVKFGDLASMQRYVDRVLSRESVRAYFGDQGSVVVEARRGDRAAEYHADLHTIRVPMMSSGRSLRTEPVILHELAHHFTADDDLAAHGPEFAANHLWLIEDVMGPEARFILGVLYSDSGVDIA